MDINSLLSAFTQNANQRMQQNADALADVNARTAQIQQLMTTNEAEAAALIQESSKQAAEGAAIQYRVDKAKEANAALVGMNPDDLDNEMVRSMAAFTQDQELAKRLEQERAATLRTAEQMAGTNFLENPLQYLVAQLALPTVAAKHNSLLNREAEAVARRDRAANNITTRMQLLTSRNSAVVANTADQAHELSLRKAQLAERQAKMELVNMQIDNISKLGARALDAYRLAGDSFQIQSDLINKAISLEQWKLQRQQMAEARAAAAEERKARADAKAETDAEIAAMNQRLAAVSAALGYHTPVTVALLKTMPDKKKAAALYEMALSGTFGESILQSLYRVESLGQSNAVRASNPGMANFMRGTKMGIQNFSEDVVREITTGKLPKNTDVAEEAARRYELSMVESAQSFASPKSLNSGTWDSTLNPYKPQYFAVLDAVKAGQVPQLKGNAVVSTLETVKAATAGAGRDNLTGKDMESLVKTVSQQVADGKLPLDKAVQDIVRFHQVAAAQNLGLYNYTQFGLPQQTSAIITVPAMNMFSQPFKIDLMDPASVKKEITRMAVDQKKGTLGAISSQQTQNLQANPILQGFNRALGVRQQPAQPQ